MFSIMAPLNLPFWYTLFKLDDYIEGYHHPHTELNDGEYGVRLQRNQTRTEKKDEQKERKKYIVNLRQS